MQTYEASNSLKKALEAKPQNRKDIIGALMGEINADPKFQTNSFQEAIAYTLKYGVKEEELYLDFNGSLLFEKDENKWDKKYLSYAKLYLTLSPAFLYLGRSTRRCNP